MFKSARKILLLFTVCCLLFAANTSWVIAQVPTATPTPNGSLQLQSMPGEPNWKFDAEVTQVGKNAERARQLVFWILKNPPLFNAPILATTWAFVRNVSYVLSVLVIIGLALHLVMATRTIGPTFSGISLGLERINLMNIIIRIIAILIFITFSYISVRGMVEGSEVVSRFFIERLGGEDLFNIVFAGGNVEQNYTDFVGFRNMDPYQQEMANTSLFVVRLTAFTYYFMSVILILRHVILIFLLILSPILALLLPFIFIRNTGFVWIGEFLRWLFYGPLVALFVAALAKIWKAGIPYAFDFTRAKAGEVVYPTAINILYGGPAQNLSPTNTANYVDTFAEYIIALVMLWAAILLPWLLLRIFRDYCCEILEKNQATLMQILDKLRTVGPTPQPPAAPEPTTPTGISFKLPFREKVSAPEMITREKVIEKIREKEIHTVETRDIARAFQMSVSSLRDIARIETNNQTNTMIRSTLERIQNPAAVTNIEERRHFETLKDEITKRALQGDQIAHQIIQATTPKVAQVTNVTSNVSSTVLRDAVQKPGVPIVVPSIMRIPTVKTITPTLVATVAQRTQVAQEKVDKILKSIPMVAGTEEEKVTTISGRVAVSKEKVREVLARTSEEVAKTAKIPMPAVMSIEEYEEVKKMWVHHYRKSDVPLSDNIKDRDAWLKEDIKKLTNTIDLLISPSLKDRQAGMQEVANLLPFLLLGGFTDLETLTYIKAKLEAAKVVMEEMEQVEKAKEAVEKDEEEKLKVPREEKKEEEKTMEVARAMEEELPEENQKEPFPKQDVDQPLTKPPTPTLNNDTKINNPFITGNEPNK